ncbi:MAG: caspase family protein [Chitinophagales bacterium]|nr:caspase family protein [Chitinophagales bacterium]
MKQVFTITMLLFMVMFSQAEKYALIVAIGNYPDPGKNGWGKISSQNDVPLIKKALLNQKFEESNITLLADEKATKEGIVAALDNLASRAKKGDIVVIHFSSHGEQIEDDNQDEVDGLDETLVPYGAVYTRNPKEFDKYKAGYLRDDEFGDKITTIRNNIGKDGDLLVLLDACHSGTGTRGPREDILAPRGGLDPMVSERFSTPAAADLTDVFKDDESKSKVKLNADASAYVVISGAQAKEFNYECYDDDRNPVGSLSYAFSKASLQLKDKTTYRGLFAEVENIMRDKAPRQKPVLEGDGIDRELFGGKFVKQELCHQVQFWFTSNELTINAGLVAGITKDTKVKLKANPTDKEYIASGIVTKVENFKSTIQLDKKDDALAKTKPWVFVTEIKYDTKVVLDVLNDKKILDQLKKDFSSFALVSFSEKSDVYLEKGSNGWDLKFTRNGETFASGIQLTGDGYVDKLKETLIRYDRFRYLVGSGSCFEQEYLTAKVELVFLNADKSAIDTAMQNSRTVNGRLELKLKDQVYLKVTNTGDRGAYINIVDIQPDGFINPILPNKKNQIRKEDCFVRSGESKIFKTYKITIAPPVGQETFKVFLSDDEIDLEDLLVTNDPRNNVNSRGNISNMAKLLMNSQVNATGTRGAEGSIDTDQNGTSFNVGFSIVK